MKYVVFLLLLLVASLGSFVGGALYAVLPDDAEEERANVRVFEARLKLAKIEAEADSVRTNYAALRLARVRKLVVKGGVSTRELETAEMDVVLAELEELSDAAAVEEATAELDAAKATLAASLCGSDSDLSVWKYYIKRRHGQSR